MNDHDEWESDEALASAANLPAFDDAKREELLAATTRVIRTRRNSRVVMQAAAIILAFVSGMIAMNQFGGSASSSHSEPNSPLAATTPSNFQPLKSATDDSAIFNDPEALARAYDAATPGERLSLLKRAGDYALNERGDLRDALDYYRQWMRAADPPTRSTFDGSDSWLLASLKHDQ